jgi:hypothetical protein
MSRLSRDRADQDRALLTQQPTAVVLAQITRLRIWTAALPIEQPGNSAALYYTIAWLARIALQRNAVRA